MVSTGNFFQHFQILNSFKILYTEKINTSNDSSEGSFPANAVKLLS